MVAAATAVMTGTILTSSLLPRGLTRPVPGLHWTNNQRQFVRKTASNVITAKFELKPPPYPLNALEPNMSQETLEYHWGKHHRAYVENLNKQIAGTELNGMSLEEIVIVSYNNGDMLPAFNNAAQAWNHQFFWESMKPGGGGKPSGELLSLIERDFGSFERFVEEFKSAAATQFGSGWAWLSYKANRLNVGNAVNPSPSDEDKKLVVVKSPNAVNPLVWDYSPLLTIDVWEHAYYLDFQNRRPDYISTFMEKLVSWDAVSDRLENAKARAAEREKEEERRRKEEEGEKAGDDEAVEVYLDSEHDESEVE
ncbi:superoxide dismutase [Fe], chloroplastic isoform X1 [Carica papaya]|uniref:superoxide dismutase [Fe], chloroplastic isoform X1 n=1 Tax=Carica papaya TaxID=3649 RepID=UPI000B8CC5AE|nr:superoxide dismutase [Fe], chloroplastic isoform X1 [Carica papaya]